MGGTSSSGLSNIICPSCNFVLTISEDIKNDELIQCPKCEVAIKNPFFLKNTLKNKAEKDNKYIDIKNALNDLINGGEFLIISINDFYVQFMSVNQELYCEAVSEKFLPSLGDKKEEFQKISFTIEDGNYFKYFDLNTITIDNVIEIVEKIFVELYKIPFVNYQIQLKPVDVADNDTDKYQQDNVDDNYYLGDKFAYKIICPKCNNAQTVVKSFRTKDNIKCPFCSYVYENPITSKDKKALDLILYTNPSNSNSNDKYSNTRPSVRHNNIYNQSIYNNTEFHLTKKQKNWIAAIVIFVIILIIGYATDDSTSNSLYTVNTTTYVATSKSSFDEMFRYLNDGDNQALSTLMSNGQVQTLSSGTKVYLVSSHFSYCVVRLQGSTGEFWIITEHITKD